MSADKKPGEAFEEAFRRSIPSGVYIRRLRTPTSMGFLVPKLAEFIGELIVMVRGLRAALEIHGQGVADGIGDKAGFLVQFCRLCGREGLTGVPHKPDCLLDIETPSEVPEWVTKANRFSFTPKAGFDLLLTVPAVVEPGWPSLPPPVPPFGFVSGAAKPMPIYTKPSLFFALELKSVDGVSLPFSNVDADQEKALAEAAVAGHVACLVIEFRQAGEVWAVPIQVWQEIRRTATRKSLPIEDARRAGMEILADLDRGVSKPYWNVAAWLSECGALLPGKPVKEAKKKPAESVKAPDPEPVPGKLFEF